ncbi:hypothetical protein [Alicyclobacillus contaminans]|nr:hypothetical protein [Alicyclobacillus contaminans]
MGFGFVLTIIVLSALIGMAARQVLSGPGQTRAFSGQEEPEVTDTQSHVM